MMRVPAAQPEPNARNQAKHCLPNDKDLIERPQGCVPGGASSSFVCIWFAVFHAKCQLLHWRWLGLVFA